MDKLIAQISAYATAAIMLMICGVHTLNGEDKPETPRIAVAVPFAMSANATTKVTVRGWKLDREIQASTTVAGVTLKVLRHDKAPVPNGQDAKLIGDTLVELEVTVPENFSNETLPLTLQASGSEGATSTLLVGGSFPVLNEVEPNDGFRQAQPIAVPQIVNGQIQVDRDVDVFSFQLATEQRIVIEIFARRHGSGLDSLLTIFDSKGRRLASNDDAEGSDSKIETVLPSGKYFVVVQDALDHGGPAHPYRMVIR